MVQEDKRTCLLKDLCARLPYGVKCEYDNLRYGGVFKVTDIEYNGYISGVIDNKHCWTVFDPLELKPYLFPLSSMTDKDLVEFFQIKGLNLNSDELKTFRRGITVIASTLPSYSRHIDWLNKNHFDYRGLIEKGLAIDATGLNIY